MTDSSPVSLIIVESSLGHNGIDKHCHHCNNPGPLCFYLLLFLPVFNVLVFLPVFSPLFQGKKKTFFPSAVHNPR